MPLPCDENKLQIGDLIRLKEGCSYAYAKLEAGMLGLVYRINKSKTRYRILLNNGKKAEVSMLDMSHGRLELLNR